MTYAYAIIAVIFFICRDADAIHTTEACSFGLIKDCLNESTCWVRRRFEYDDSWTACHGDQYITKFTDLYVGVVLCTNARYKLYLSQSLEDPFLNIADRSGQGEDHCQFIGGTRNTNIKVGKATWEVPPNREGFYRADWGEKVQKGVIGHSYPYVDWYVCGVLVPGRDDKVVDNLSFSQTAESDTPNTRPQTTRPSGRLATTSHTTESGLFSPAGSGIGSEDVTIEDARSDNIRADKDNDTITPGKLSTVLPIALSVTAILCVVGVVCGIVLYFGKRVTLKFKSNPPKYPSDYNYIDIKYEQSEATLDPEETHLIVPPALPERKPVNRVAKLMVEKMSETTLKEQLEALVLNQSSSPIVTEDDDVPKPNENGYMPLNSATRENNNQSQLDNADKDSAEEYKKPVGQTPMAKEPEAGTKIIGNMPQNQTACVTKSKPLPVYLPIIDDGEPIIETEGKNPIIPPLPDWRPIQFLSELKTDKVVETASERKLEVLVPNQSLSPTVPEDAEDIPKPNENGYMPLNPATRENNNQSQIDNTDRDSDEGYEKPVGEAPLAKEPKTSVKVIGNVPLNQAACMKKPPPLPVCHPVIGDDDSDEGYEKPVSPSKKVLTGKGWENPAVT